MTSVMIRCPLQPLWSQHRFILAPLTKRLYSSDDIDVKRNVSRMRRRKPLTLQRVLFSAPKVNRQRMINKFWASNGRESGVDPRMLWPSESKLKEMKALEDRLFPSLQTMRDGISYREARQKAYKEKWQNDVEEKMKTLQDKIKDFEKRRDEKLKEVEKQRLQKQKMLEEIRAFLGYRIDPKDERFRQIVEEKEKEQLKAAKEAKKKEKIARSLAKLEAEAKAAQEQRLAEQSVPSSSS